MKIYPSAEALIGKTPLVRFSRLEKELNLNFRLLVKLEFFNPAGSAKDRAALYMLDAAEKNGLIKKGSVIIEPTSGNTGIGLASVSAIRGYRTIIVMPDTMSAERITLMKAYGAELVLTDGKLGMSGAVLKAEELSRQIPNSYIAGQFVNPANAEAHFKTTGPEIFEDTDGEVDYFVAGVGTGGTITGVGRYLKSKNDNIKIIAVEPESSPLLSKGTAGAHKLQGIGANFVPELLDKNAYDDIVTVSNDEAYEMTAKIGGIEGVLGGISGGAALAAAIKLSKTHELDGKTVVVFIPDNGDHYLTTGVYDL